MAQMSVTIPMLRDAMLAYKKNRLDGEFPKGFNTVATYLHEVNHGISVHFSGSLSYAGKDGSGIEGCGTVTLVHGPEVFIYHGQWWDSHMLADKFVSENFFVTDGKLTYTDLRKKTLVFDVDTRSEGEWAETPDCEYIRIKDLNVEFPLVPNHYLRILGPDGEYVELNVEVCLSEDSVPIRQIGTIDIYRFTRSFTVKNKEGKTVDGYLDISHDRQFIRWSSQAPDFCFEKEVKVEMRRFRAWFEDKVERNLLRALDVRAPSIPKNGDIGDIGSTGSVV